MLNDQTGYRILGGPRDGELIILPPNEKSFTVMILHDPKILNALGPDAPLPTTAFRYVAVDVQVGNVTMAVLAPDFWKPAEVLLALLSNYQGHPVVGLRP